MISVIAGHTGCGKTLFSTVFSYLLKSSGSYDFLLSNYRMEHSDEIISRLSDFNKIPRNQNVLVISDEAYEDIDSRKFYSSRVNTFSKNIMQLRKRGGKGFDTDLWIIVQHFDMIDYRIRMNTSYMYFPKIVSWNHRDEPEYMIVDIMKYNPLFGFGQTKTFSLYVHPFLGLYDTDEMITGTEVDTNSYDILLEKYIDDPRLSDLKKDQIVDLIYVENLKNTDMDITKSMARTVANLISIKKKEHQFMEQGILKYSYE